jgi:hypothetical protein
VQKKNDFWDWETWEQKVARSLKIPPQEKLRILGEALDFFSKIKRLVPRKHQDRIADKGVNF